MKKSYGSDTKSAYIEQMESDGKSVPEAAKELGITENMLYNWRKKLQDGPKRGRPVGEGQKPDEEYLRKTGKENIQPKRYAEKGHSIDSWKRD